MAVLSIDPSSPFTHGALLGDRIRLTDHFLDPGVYIRSMASRGSLGGLSEATLQAALLMDASGKDDVFLETVGVGQAEVDIIDHADTVVLVLMPGSGDSIQALKAGVMEIPDVIAVNKADHPLTDTMVREIRGVLSLGRRRAGGCRSSRPRRAGARVSRSWPTKIGEHREFIESEGTLAERRRRNLMNEVIALAAGRMRRKLEAEVRGRRRGAETARRGGRETARPGERGCAPPGARDGVAVAENPARSPSGATADRLAGWASRVRTG